MQLKPGMHISLLIYHMHPANDFILLFEGHQICSPLFLYRDVEGHIGSQVEASKEKAALEQ